MFLEYREQLRLRPFLKQNTGLCTATCIDFHQFLKSDPIKKLESEAKYNSLREHFSEHWGPHTSLDVTKIKQELTEMQGDDPGWRKYLQNSNYFVGSLEQTMQRDANDAVIYGPAPAATYLEAR